MPRPPTLKVYNLPPITFIPSSWLNGVAYHDGFTTLRMVRRSKTPPHVRVDYYSYHAPPWLKGLLIMAGRRKDMSVGKVWHKIKKTHRNEIISVAKLVEKDSPNKRQLMTQLKLSLEPQEVTHLA